LNRLPLPHGQGSLRDTARDAAVAIEPFKL
jgi:hypothetical protein